MGAEILLPARESVPLNCNRKLLQSDILLCNITSDPQHCIGPLKSSSHGPPGGGVGNLTCLWHRVEPFFRVPFSR